MENKINVILEASVKFRVASVLTSVSSGNLGIRCANSRISLAYGNRDIRVTTVYFLQVSTDTLLSGMKVNS